jgi:hypothetical protein
MVKSSLLFFNIRLIPVTLRLLMRISSQQQNTGAFLALSGMNSPHSDLVWSDILLAIERPTKNVTSSIFKAETVEDRFS